MTCMASGQVFKDKHELLSVGFDVGTTTSQMVISRLTLADDPATQKRKVIISDRKVIYESDIFLTPFDSNRIDLPRLKERFDLEFRKACVSREKMDTGAVILTGVAAESPNAKEVVAELSSGGGKFVSATAGPHFESLIAARGAGTVELSRSTGKTILHVDIGGGTSNLAVVSAGNVVATACIFIGGRLVQRRYGVMTSAHPAIMPLAKFANVILTQGAPISTASERNLCRLMAQCLLEVMSGSELSEHTHELMRTEPLDYEGNIDSVRFSGGVADYIYGTSAADYGDIGASLGEAIRDLVSTKFHIEPPGETLRATVIGAGVYTLQVSGTTTLIDAGILPKKDVVALPVTWKKALARKVLRQEVASAVERAVQIQPEDGKYALLFDSIPRIYEDLTKVAQGIIDVVGHPPLLILICREDVGRSLGNVIRRETGFEGRIISIDEVEMEGGDFVDLGEMIEGTGVIPVVVKTLSFK